MKPLKTCSHIVLVCEGEKNSGFSRLHLIICGVLWEHILRKELFCQTVYQNDSSSTDRVIHGAEAPKGQKIASLIKWSRVKQSLFIPRTIGENICTSVKGLPTLKLTPTSTPPQPKPSLPATILSPTHGCLSTSRKWTSQILQTSSPCTGHTHSSLNPGS